MILSTRIIDDENLNANYTGDWVYQDKFQSLIDQFTIHIAWTGSDKTDGTFYVDLKIGEETVNQVTTDNYITIGTKIIDGAAGTYTLFNSADCVGFRVRYTKGTTTAGTFDAIVLTRKVA